jgi:hypothetical protein
MSPNTSLVTWLTTRRNLRSGHILWIVLGVANSAYASEWVSVGKSLRSEEFADIASLQIDGNIRHVLIKSVYPPHSERDPNDANKWWDSKVNQMAFNCVDGTSRRESMEIYYSDGTKFNIPDGNVPTLWRPVQPNTLLNEEMLLVCMQKPKMT